MADKPRILVVDDEPLIVKLLAKHLEEDGFTVLTAMDGYEALTKARAESPDLILLDVILPKLNGFEVCTMLK
ncbi:MAG: response regulator, partial [Candidatus Omnitrophica bacterium]|nr:response regulator [Candidatus Omnitrophota bacterium]